MVHTRDAEDEPIAILRDELDEGRVRGRDPLLHGDDEARARRARARLLHFGLEGIATFKKADELRATIKDVPLDRLLVETDAPYLAPQGKRGKRNEPAFIVLTAEMLAELKASSFDTLGCGDDRRISSGFSPRRSAAIVTSLVATILGSGSSAGVPRLGGPQGAGDWGACDTEKSEEPAATLFAAGAAGRDHGPRRTSPDLREQLLAARIAHLDGVRDDASARRSDQTA